MPAASACTSASAPPYSSRSITWQTTRCCGALCPVIARAAGWRVSGPPPRSVSHAPRLKPLREQRSGKSWNPLDDMHAAAAASDDGLLGAAVAVRRAVHVHVGGQLFEECNRFWRVDDVHVIDGAQSQQHFGPLMLRHEGATRALGRTHRGVTPQPDD